MQTKSALARTQALPRRLPVIPDWTVISAPAARQALEGMLASDHGALRFAGLDAHAAVVLAAVLRLYAACGRPPGLAEIEAATGMTEAAVHTRLDGLAQCDLVLASNGIILGAYPFIERATGHAVTFKDGGVTLATMCAIDALGAGAMCRADAVARSVCPLCGASISCEIGERGIALQATLPGDAVVWLGLDQSQACGCAADTLCRDLLFFCCDDHLDQWRATGRGRRGHRLLPEEAFQVGKALFIDRALMSG